MHRDAKKSSILPADMVDHPFRFIAGNVDRYPHRSFAENDPCPRSARKFEMPENELRLEGCPDRANALDLAQFGIDQINELSRRSVILGLLAVQVGKFD
jgi:hypothetical protein